MIDQLNPRARRDQYGSKINRDQSPVLAIGMPWITAILGSLTPLLPLVASAPFLPPFGFLVFLAWRLARPGLLPVWAGVPLGAINDLYSGQPFGSAIMLWSLTMLAIEIIEARFPWRDFWQDWILAAVMLIVYIVCAALVAGFVLTFASVALLLPQILISILLFPIISRVVAVLDRWRLARIKVLR